MFEFPFKYMNIADEVACIVCTTNTRRPTSTQDAGGNSRVKTFSWPKDIIGESNSGDGARRG